MKATDSSPASRSAPAGFGGVRGAHFWRNFWVYALLVAGSAVFMYPFIWMASASVKLDRELFSEGAGILPAQPVPRLVSPYLETRVHYGYEHPRLAEFLPALLRAVEERKVSWPTGIDRASADQELAIGLFRRIAKLAPPEWWERPATELEPLMLGLITQPMIESERAALARGLVIGRLVARSYDLEETVVVRNDDIADRWSLEGSARAEFSLYPPAASEGRILRYEFTSGDRVVLRTEAKVGFSLDRLHRLQLFLRPDDSWHALDVTVEMKGKVYRAERSATLSDFTWTTLTWQEPGPDDLTNQQKTWILLREQPGATSRLTSPDTLAITLELRQRGVLAAWWAKIQRNYVVVLEHIPFGRYVATSLFLVILQIVCTVFSCSLVAYSFARLRWPGRSACFVLMLATMMLPGQVTMIPQFLIIRDLGWYNTLLPLWVPSLTASAFNVFLLNQFMKGIPRDLEDAARIDGCGVMRIYWHVIMPSIRPSLVVIGIFTFMGVWNDFMGPLIYLQDQRLYPLSLGLYALNVQSGGSMAMMMAGSLLMTLPVIAIFFFGQRYFIRGITLTGMKG
ncbi:MAG: ABC transporter permease subunit [Opitutaceae bacterium]|nr:ABC transporter permease subunit [Opitutaceae bacterium]